MYEIIGIDAEIQPLDKKMADRLPLYLSQGYKWHHAALAGRSCILAEVKNIQNISITSIYHQFAQVRTLFGLPVIAVVDALETYNRRRLIEKKIPFIVPGKQLYIPDFFIDLREWGNTPKKEKEQLTPLAQELLLLYILDKNSRNPAFANKPFKELAQWLDTNPMSITRAAENLKQLELIEVTGEKEKYIRFRLERHELWHEAMNRKLWINPVLKKVYVDELPKGIFMLRSNLSALPEYTDMNPSRQPFFAIEKNKFYQLQKNNLLRYPNEHEGNYCLEVWKYNPEKLSEVAQPDRHNIVDPLSLYLSLQDSHDERIAMALDQIINNNYTW